MEPTPAAANGAERARLAAMVESLTEEDLRRPLENGWTAAVALAHLAYWDRRMLAALEEWERGEVRWTPADADLINEAELPGWQAMAPTEAVREALAAAEAVDRKVESLAPEVAAAVMAVRPRALVRAAHRKEHLDEIERALRPEGAS